MGPNGVNPRVLKELVDDTVAPPDTIFQWSWGSGHVLVNWKLTNVTIFKERRKTLVITGLSISLQFMVN